MKVIYNRVIPFKGFLAINLFGIVFVRKGAGKMSERLLMHEAIHTAQMKELGYLFFYLLYALEWIVRLCKGSKAPYRSLSFEREAYDNDSNKDYLLHRKYFAMWRRSGSKPQEPEEVRV